MRLRTRLGTLPGAATVLGAVFLALALLLMTSTARAAETAEGDVLGLGLGGPLDVGTSDVVPQAGAAGVYRLDGTGITTTTSYSLVRIGAGGVGGSVGLATVDGANTMLTISNFMDVGNSGLGRLIVSNGGRIDTLGGTNIGGLGGATGYALVSAGQLNLGNGLVVGNGNFNALATSGALVVESGGTVSVTGPNGVALGWEPLATGTLTVDGGTSSFTTATGMTVGRGGTGAVAVTGGGTLSVSGESLVGNQPGARGSVLVSGAGSTWTVDGAFLLVGQQSAGQLVVAAGGSVTTTTGHLEVGSNAGGQGSALVTGAGSQLTVEKGLFVGQQATGALTVADGGTVTINNSGGQNTQVGLNGPSGNGMLVVRGTGSSLETAKQFHIGNQANGQVVVQDGGTLTTPRMNVGFQSGGTGHLVVRGSGARLRLLGEDPANPGSGAQVAVGTGGGYGALVVEQGGRIEMDSSGLPGPGDPNLVSGSRLRVGLLGSGVGAATITGAGSVIDIVSSVNNAGVFVGRETATGTLTVADGGAITVSGPTPLLVVGRHDGSAGTLNVLRGGSLVFQSTDGGATGRVARDPGSFGSVTVSGPGSLIEFPVLLMLGLQNDIVPPGPADQGGSAVLTVANGGTVRVNPDGSGILRIGSGDILKGNGVVDASVENFGGIIEPGLSPGTLTITGNYVGGPGSRIILEVGSTPAASDTLVIGGTVQLDPTSSITVVVNEQPPEGSVALIKTDGGDTLLAVTTSSSGDIAVQPSAALPTVPTTVTGGGTSISVTVDIKPGDATNTIKLGTGGAIPMAILSSSTFHAPSMVDPATIRLAGAKVKMAGKSDKTLCHAEDVNGDAVTDLVCQVVMSEVQLIAGATIAVMNAHTFSTMGGQLVIGSDTVRVIP